MHEIEAQQKATELVDNVQKLLGSQSGLDKLDLREKFVSEWEKLSCDDRKSVGKQIEKLSAPKEYSQESLKLRANFNYKDGEIKSLDFSKLYEEKTPGMTMVRLRKETESFEKPLDNCKK